MTRHRAVLEAGPGTIRRLCCGTGKVADEDLCEVVREALAAVDDRVALVDGRPVAVDSLWRAALRSMKCANGDGLVVVHPSWWPSSRVDRVTRAAKNLGDNALARPRSWLLRRAPEAQSDAGAVVVVEIAERLVAITGAEVAAIPRVAEAHSVAEEVATVIAGMTAAAILIDAPSTVSGAPALAALIADAVRESGRAAVEIGDARLARLAQSAASLPDEARGSAVNAETRGVRSRARTAGGLAAAALVLTALPLAISGSAPRGGHGPSPPAAVLAAPTTFLVEGRVALTVPADWSAQRLITGPGSARVQVTSPADPEVALHLTQSPVPGETLRGTAERLKRAIDAEPTGVFVDFNPSGSSAGRPAVTYREVRATHQVRWIVLLDGPVRISVGCQSRPAREEAVRDACEQAVRSAHAIG
ncbi:type VII secretion-associated protein [Mycobacterium sp. 852002-50816_SCH5313054-b]|uniref:type VII secretion-associated protein n=1 Tax=Mycobacterium sp. 852002-50816_SCH5313054-b TaxID=1834092 RepID=UPI000800BF78|nr:type VII secretion-associated protein [Mycobacterium sp. 852002-50816_SCH5313054-b]OBF60271.1 type VII secretion-associated protein [Mycobacterium sp. 852002-50816_SCH5313054-b]